MHPRLSTEATRALAARAVDRLGGVRTVVTLGWTFGVPSEPVPRRRSTTVAPHSGVVARRLSLDELRTFGSDPVLDLEPDFLDQVAALGHLVYGVIEDDQLRAYELFSAEPTLVPNGVTATFAPHHRYVYKAFTRPDRRGGGLHGLITRTAANDFRREGAVGMVAYARASNHASVRSFRRLGFQITGVALLPEKSEAPLLQQAFTHGPAWLRFDRVS